MMTQEKISRVLGFSQPSINLVLTGKRAVSWPLAEKLADLFPGKTIQQWKSATPDELKRAFSLLEIENNKEVA
jgi:plasmid maintenance system antidote protein VapI